LLRATKRNSKGCSGLNYLRQGVNRIESNAFCGSGHVDDDDTMDLSQHCCLKKGKYRGKRQRGTGKHSISNMVRPQPPHYIHHLHHHNTNG
jgi:hypothetical protein